MVGGLVVGGGFDAAAFGPVGTGWGVGVGLDGEVSWEVAAGDVVAVVAEGSVAAGFAGGVLLLAAAAAAAFWAFGRIPRSFCSIFLMPSALPLRGGARFGAGDGGAGATIGAAGTAFCTRGD